MRKLLFVALFCSAVAYTASAQNDIQFSNYMFSEITYNPAMAGNTNTLDATLLHRSQWTGFDEAPRTQLLSMHKYVAKASGGVGFSLINDQLGHEHFLNAKFMYAYQLRLSEKSRLSFGLAFGVLNRALKGSELIYDDMTDPGAVLTNISSTRPDFDFGIGFNSEKLTVGLSTTHIEQSLKASTILKAPRHYYFIAKYKIKASDKINIIPSVKVRSSEFITQFDATALMFYNSRFWVGASYRLDDAIVGLLGLQINKNFRIGYSYDYSAAALKKYNNGSHEIILMASFDVNKKVIPIKTPRFFD